jgi:seryl-tRNA synthetase
MYAIAYVREHAEEVRSGLRARNRDPALVDRILALDEQVREIAHRVNPMRAERNRAARGLASSARNGGARDHAQLARLRDGIQALEAEAARWESERDGLLRDLPQVPHPSVPRGTGPRENLVIAEVRSSRPGPTEPRPHDEIGHALNLLDEERGVKVASEGFFVLWADLARLEHALIRYMRDIHHARGFVEVVPPTLINSDAMVGTGQLPKFAEDSYQVKRDELWLAPTAEVPVTNLFRDEVLLPGDLPLRLMAATACFRREAGGHGVETRGIARVHQFDKVELVILSRPEESYAELEALREEVERVIRPLDLPYRVVSLCTGDLPDKAAKGYDLELWAPGSRRWLEVSSISNFEAYQATRARIRWRPKAGASAEPVHTLNASGVALPRLLIAILENYQTEDGRVEVPEALRPELNGQQFLRANPLIGERELARGRHGGRTAPCPRSSDAEVSQGSVRQAPGPPEEPKRVGPPA